MNSTATSISARLQHKMRTRTSTRTTRMTAANKTNNIPTATRTTKMPAATKKTEKQAGIMETKTAATQVLSTYELAWMIAQHLDPTSIIRLSMTGCFLYQALNPLFWANLDLYNTNQSKHLPLSVPAQWALSRNLSKIKSIKLDNSTLLYFVARTLLHPDNNASRAAARTTRIIYNTASWKKHAPTLRSRPEWLPELPLANPFSVTLQPLAGLTSLEYTGPYSEDRSIFAESVVPSFYENCQEQCANRVPKVPGQLELIWILELHPTLTHLCLDNYIISSDYVASFFIRAVSRLTRLLDLDVFLKSCVLMWPNMVQALFYNLPSTIKNLRLCCLNGSNRHHPLTFAPGCEDLQLPTLPESGAAPPTRRNGPLPFLKNLQIGLEIDQHVWVLDRIVAWCPGLETFTPPRCLTADCRSLAKVVAQNCPRLRELNNSGLGSLAIANELPAYSLKIIHGQDYEQANMVLTTISTRHFDSIREIRMLYPHIDGPVIQKILSTCRVLEHLTLGKGCRTSVLLKDLVEKEWTCLRLKVLNITVDLRQHELPAYKLWRKGRGFPIVSDETWTTLKKFYRQLGALSEIEVLDLRIASKELEWLDENGQERQNQPNNGHDSDDTWRTDDSTRNSFDHPLQDHLKNELEHTHDKSFPGLLSLGDEMIGRPGYLGWLSGLTKLKELRGHVQVTTMETRRTVGQREMEWMSDHWPRLRVIELIPFDIWGSGGFPYIQWFQEKRPGVLVRKTWPSY